MDFDRKRVGLPDPKRIKAKYLLAELALARGHQEASFRLMREVAGSAEHWTITCPEL